MPGIALDKQWKNHPIGADVYFDRMYVKDHIKRNPMLHVKNLKVERRKPEFYIREEQKAFFTL